MITRFVRRWCGLALAFWLGMMAARAATDSEVLTAVIGAALAIAIVVAALAPAVIAGLRIRNAVDGSDGRFRPPF